MLTDFEEATPYATQAKSLLYYSVKNKISKNELDENALNRFNRLDIADKLIHSGGKNYFLMTQGIYSKLSLGVELSVDDKEILCEAYYNGCYGLYEIKNKLNIKCGS